MIERGLPCHSAFHRAVLLGAVPLLQPSTKPGAAGCGPLLAWAAELRSAVADRLDERQKIQLGNDVMHWSISNLLHGEQGALSLSASLCHILLDPGAQEYAANQAREEARHVAGFTRYIAKRWGDPLPVGKTIAGVLAAFVWRHADPQPPRPRYSWEDEAEEPAPDPELELPSPGEVPVAGNALRHVQAGASAADAPARKARWVAATAAPRAGPAMRLAALSHMLISGFFFSQAFAAASGFILSSRTLPIRVLSMFRVNDRFFSNWPTLLHSWV